MVPSIRITSCMAPNMEPMVVELAAWLSTTLGQPVDAVGFKSWRQRERAFDGGDIDFIWICGLPYVWKADDPNRSVRLVAAPVMAADRYNNRPVYYSDILVRRGSGYQSFDDLAGSRWAINEPRSHSGFNLTRWYLAQNGLNWEFFGSVVTAGSHEAALARLLEGELDAAAIDSTVYEQELRTNPALQGKFRVIETLGPSPIPPWIARDGLNAEVSARLQSALLSLGQEPTGKKILEQAGMARMVVVDDRDYDLIRSMDQTAQQVPDLDEIAG